MTYPITVTRMQMCKFIYMQRWAFGSLVAIWLLLGGLALAEQLNVVSETGPHDEQTLEHLQLAVKSESCSDSTRPLSPDLLQLAFAVCPVTMVPSVVANPAYSVFSSTHIRSLVLLTRCYRI